MVVSRLVSVGSPVGISELFVCDEEIWSEVVVTGFSVVDTVSLGATVAVSDDSSSLVVTV